MGGCCSTSKSVDLPPVPAAPAKQRPATLPEFPGSSNNAGAFGGSGGVTNRALEED